MAETKIKAGQFSGIVGHGTDGYFLMTNGDGTMAWAEGGATGPSVTSVSYPGDDLAADPTGGQTIVLTGAGFAASGMTVSIGGTTAPSVAHDSNTQLTISTPAKAAGDYDIVVTNTVTGASGTFVNGISYNGIPSWTTAAGSLGTFESETTISTITLQATEPDGGTITFNITNGALPTGLSLTGANIDGTTTAESSTTLYSFTIEAIDDENQSTPRNFSITVNAAELISSENFTINTYTGNGSTQSIEGKIGTAASFNGSNSYILLNGINNTNFTPTAYTVSAWFKTTATDDSIFSTDAGGNPISTRTRIHVNSSGYIEYEPSTLSSKITSSITVNDGNWHFVAVSTDSSGNTKLYVDNESAVTGTGGSINFRAETWIGCTDTAVYSTIGRNNFFNGLIDQVRIFDKALSSGEVTTLYGENNASSTKSTTDIFDDGSGIALYEFEEGAKDSSIIQITSIATYELDGDATDVSSTYNGTYNGAFVTGKFGQGLDVGSSAPYGLLTGLTLNSNTVTYSMWCNFKDHTTNYFSLASNVGFDANEYQYGRQNLLWATQSNYFVQSTGNGVGWTDTNMIPTPSNAVSQYHGVDQWFHIAAVYNNTNLKIYLNGTEIVSATIPNVSYNTTNKVGFASYQYSGRNEIIDQCRVFDSALDSTSIQTLYNETSASATSNSVDVEGLYSGTPTNVSFVGTSFQPDLIWAKVRDGSTSHVLFDSVRGRNSVLYSNLSAQEVIPDGTTDLLSFDSNGFTVGTDAQANINTNGNDLVAWCWKAGGTAVSNTDGVTSGSVTAVTSTVSANQDAGFSICEFTTPSSGKPSWGHGLSQEPELIIVKNAGSTGHWLIYAPSILGQKELRFTTAQATSYTPDFISADSSKIDLGSSSFNIAGSSRHINYNFHSVDGYQKVGSYTGNGGTLNVTTGFAPRFVMLKPSSLSDNWIIYDTSRGKNIVLFPNLANGDSTYTDRFSFLNDGFQLSTSNSGWNGNNSTYIYLAIA